MRTAMSWWPAAAHHCPLLSALMQSDHNGSRRLNKLYMRAAPLGFVDHKKNGRFSRVFLPCVRVVVSALLTRLKFRVKPSLIESTLNDF